MEIRGAENANPIIPVMPDNTIEIIHITAITVTRGTKETRINLSKLRIIANIFSVSPVAIRTPVATPDFT